MVETAIERCPAECPLRDTFRFRLLRLVNKNCGGPEFIAASAEIITDYEKSQAERKIVGEIVCGRLVTNHMRDVSAYLQAHAADRFNSAAAEITGIRPDQDSDG